MRMQWKRLQRPHCIPACSSRQEFLQRMSSSIAPSCCLESWSHGCSPVPNSHYSLSGRKATSNMVLQIACLPIILSESQSLKVCNIRQGSSLFKIGNNCPPIVKEVWQINTQETEDVSEWYWSERIRHFEGSDVKWSGYSSLVCKRSQRVLGGTISFISCSCVGVSCKAM